MGWVTGLLGWFEPRWGLKKGQGWLTPMDVVKKRVGLAAGGQHLDGGIFSSAASALRFCSASSAQWGQGCWHRAQHREHLPLSQ